MVYNISMSSGLSKEEIDYLLNLEKNCKSSQKYNFPSLGGKIEIELSSADKNEDFLLDVWRSHIDLAKTKFQNRARKTVPIVRLDINSAPHKNPDGVHLGGTHFHIYREGYDDKFAYPLPDEFADCKSSRDFLAKFMDYCHIMKKPIIEEDLFV